MLWGGSRKIEGFDLNTLFLLQRHSIWKVQNKAKTIATGILLKIIPSELKLRWILNRQLQV